MQNSRSDFFDIEVTPEEEEVWQNFLVKSYEPPPRTDNLETNIPKEKKDGI